MKNTKLRRWITVGLVLACCHTTHTYGADTTVLPDELSVATDFPGGSAEIREVDASSGTIHIYPALHEDRGWPCWWYFRVDGLKTGQTVVLKVSGNPRPYRKKERLSPVWAQPDCAAISTDNVTWRQTLPATKEKDQTSVYTFEAPAERIWLAWGPPFLPEHAEALLDRVARAVPGAERFVLAQTRGGRPVPGIRLGSNEPLQSSRIGVWVQARQHAWESGGSWVGCGFLEWVAGDDPAAVELRRIATIHFIPIMDVDNVTLGAGGKNATPRDHNRDWADEPHYPEVAAAQKRIQGLDEQKRLHLFIDLHDPGQRERRPYFFGPFDLDGMDASQRGNYLRWLAICSESICDPLPLEEKYHVASYVKTDEERGRMSSVWVRNHTAAYVVSATLETPWNTLHSTQEGYRAVGRQLGQAVARYVAGLPQTRD